MTLCSEWMVGILSNWTQLSSLTKKNAGVASCLPLSAGEPTLRWKRGWGHPSPAPGLIPDHGRKDVTHLGVTTWEHNTSAGFSQPLSRGVGLWPTPRPWQLLGYLTESCDCSPWLQNGSSTGSGSAKREARRHFEKTTEGEILKTIFLSLPHSSTVFERF